MKYIGIACSIFKKEIIRLISEGKLEDDFIFINSMLHMHPEKLVDVLKKITEENKEINKIIIYGECHQYIEELEKDKTIKRTHGINCIEIILGKENYYKLRREGAFFLMPEWAIRWEEVFKEELGFDIKTGKSFMREMHKKIIYIDTGEYDIPIDKIEEFKQFSGLECEIIKVDLSCLLDTIKEMERRF